MNNLDNIFQKLGIDTTNGLYYTKDTNWKADLHLSSRVERCFEQINPDALFCFDDKPLILFFENPKDKSELHKKIWNFNEAPVVIIVDNGNVEILNGFNLLEKGNLQRIGGNEDLTDFSYFQLVTGKTWENYEKELNYKNRVDYRLLSNIEDARNVILNKFPTTNDEEIKKKYAQIINALIGKIIFVRYLIDRKVELNFKERAKIWTNDDLCELLKNPDRVVTFFEYLADKEKGFNGDLFPLHKEDYALIPQEAYKTLIALLESQEIATGQKSLFDLYDFSIIPTEFISNVYEKFIGADSQSKEGAYYTPLFLVDYILSETVGTYIYDNHTYNCKTLDPACGSGVFLVEALRKLIEQYKLAPAEDIEQYKEDIKDIVRKNIFGIDKDESAVQVAIFSIYLTLLDYMQPPEIKNFQFPNLINTNFFYNDFFDEDKDFNKVLKDKDFAFIVGNPPWFRGKNEKKKTKQEPLYVQYINNRKKRESAEISIDIGNKEIAQAFLLRSSDFSSTNTKCALISTSKVLYNLQSKDFRRYFLHNYQIERVFELAPVRREVFHDKAIAPACVLFFNYSHSKNTDKNFIEHIALKPSRFFSMFKIFSIYRHDIQTVQQDRLKQYDWLWKVLVYGSYLDFNFIKRLKADYPTIQKIIDDNKDLIIGQGITVNGGDENDASDLIGMPYINTNKDIQKFWINSDADFWNNAVVHRVRNKDLYKAPVLLIKKGFNNDFSLVTAISYKNAVYTDSLTGLKGTTQNVNLLRQILGYIVSSFSAYYNFVSFSSSGIEREVVYAKEILSLPFVETNDLSNIISEIENLTNTIHSENQIDLSNQNNLRLKIDQLNDCIGNSFAISEQENTLIDYIENIVIPLQIQHKGFEKLLLPCKKDDKILTDYANLFINRFALNFEKIGKKFMVEIWHTQQIVGMFFKVISENEYTEPIVWINKQNDTSSILQKIIELGVTKITDQLFIQKDVRGFEKEYFYLFKPNEKRLWHKAVGYLDVEEFADAILKAGRDKNE